MVAFPGETILLRNGEEVELVGIDTDSGWPLCQFQRGLVIAVDPVTIQEGYRDD